MIRDAADIVCNAVIQTQVCIVGGGPAGIALAIDLAGGGTDVVLLESGGLNAEPEAQALNIGEVADPSLHSPADRYRVRCLGGATSIWGGRCMPFDPIDFEHRPWISYSGWPIGFQDVEPWYAAANRLCEAGDFEYDARLAVPGGMRPMLRGFTPTSFDINRIERFSCPTHFGERYRDRLAAVGVITHATVTRLRAAADGARIESLDVRNAGDAAFSVVAEAFVLATGGIETPRLLLVSDDVHHAGIGNAQDLVGRYYMSHIAGTIGHLRPNVPIWHGYDVAPDGTYCRRRLALRPEAQARHGIGNLIFRPHHPRITNPAHGSGALSAIFLTRRLISYEYAKRLASDEPMTVGAWLRHCFNTVADAPSTARFLSHWLRYRTLSERKFPSVIIRPHGNLFSLDFHAEQVPNPTSRICLGGAKDRHGNRQVRIDWRYTAADVETVTRAFAVLRDELADQSVAELTLAPGETSIERVIARDGAYGGHHIGTTRMGASAQTGVVDGTCKVHGVNNLFIAGSSVFSTSGQANPTLTIVALSLRLAAHLRGRRQRVAMVRTLIPAV